MQAGASVNYIEKAPTPSILMSALAKVRPTTILSVPLIIEKVYRSAVLPKLTATPLLRFMHRIPPLRKMMHRKAGKQLFEKFGGRIRFFGIGGARLDPEVERFLLEARFPYAIGYGLTETSPLIAAAPPDMVRLGSTGPVVKGVELRLLDKDPKTGVGEIAVKGDNVFKGYFNNPEATDGWFKTRDLGKLDKDGWLYIKGRSSTTIIGPSGENIYPEEVESVINSHEMVAESVVTSRKGRLTALVPSSTSTPRNSRPSSSRPTNSSALHRRNSKTSRKKSSTTSTRKSANSPASARSTPRKKSSRRPPPTRSSATSTTGPRHPASPLRTVRAQSSHFQVAALNISLLPFFLADIGKKIIIFVQL